MKKIILVVALGFMSICVFAQSPLELGRVQLNAGLGSSGWGVPFYFGIDCGIAKDFTLGGEISFQSEDHCYYKDYNSYYDSSAIGLGVSGNYHFNSMLHIPSKFDCYAGSSLSYFIWSYDNYGNNPHPDNTSFGVGLQVGGRYFFTNKFGVNLEFGGGTVTSGVKAGVTFKL
jgi:hypothetical protein